MKRDVMLTISSTQQMPGEEPETTELVTEGTLECTGDTTVLTYEETALTGLEGTETSFRITPGRIILTRTGALTSEMQFAQGENHRSLYDMGFGALMLDIHTDTVRGDVTEEGGTLEVGYTITIEEEATGWIRYLIEVRPRT